MKGQKPKPTKLKLAQGSAGRRPLPENEPEPGVRLPLAPGHLNEEAKAEWARIGADLAALGLMTSIDRAALSAYCVAWARWVDAEEKLLEFGGEDPALPERRHVLDHCEEKLKELHQETQRYSGPFELAEPVEDEVAWVQQLVEAE